MSPFQADVLEGYGQRLIPTLIDDIASSDPERPFVSIPKSTDPREGFVDVSFHAFAGAVNRCALWMEEEIGTSSEFETLFYYGTQDLLYPIILLAAVKTGHKVSILNTIQNKRYPCNIQI